MTKQELDKIKNFAEEQFYKAEVEIPYDDLISSCNNEHFTSCINPWYDSTGRFPLNDKEAVEEWGLDVVVDFCEKAKVKLGL